MQASAWYEKLAVSSVVANLATGMGVTIDIEWGEIDFSRPSSMLFLSAALESV